MYLINNPDSVKEISKNVKPEQFQNSLIRHYFEYVLTRIQRGLDPLTNVTADFTQNEVSKLYEMLSQYIKSASTEEAMREYIKVINEESEKLSHEDIESMSADELKAYIDKIRKSKK